MSSNSRNTRNKSSKKSKKANKYQVSLDTFAWCDSEGFRLDISDPIKKEEYAQLFEKKEICSICLEEFNGLRRIVKISCNHFFHARCIFIYMIKKNNNLKCPYCNRELDNVWPEE